MSSTSFEEDLSCSVCRDIYKDPVLLLCSHSFCKACLQEFWTDREDKNCPLCREVSSTLNPPRNLALKNLCDAFRGRSQEAPGPEVCSLHREKLKLFCLACLACLIGFVCQTSKKHKGHNCCPIEEASEDHKKEFQAPLKTLRDKLKVFKEIKQTCDGTAGHLKVQALRTEKQIKEEFKKLHQFLQEEEESRVAALKEEEEQKSQTMKETIEGLGREMSTLSDTITAIEQALRAEDVSFLQNYKSTLKRAQCDLPDPQLVSGALIDEAKHLGNLTFRVWEKMKERVKFTPVTLDPNTAPPWLCISDDLTSVRCTDTRQQLPDNPERNNKYPIVLGSESFSSGQHSWEVEVGDHPDWGIGVAKESYDRKSDGLFTTPQHGIWAIRYRSSEYHNGLGETLTVKRSLQRIRVQLDYNGGKVSFYDPEDMTHIYTYEHTFTEKLYPFFNIGRAGDAKHPDINICQSEVSL